MPFFSLPAFFNFVFFSPYLIRLWSFGLHPFWCTSTVLYVMFVNFTFSFVCSTERKLNHIHYVWLQKSCCRSTRGFFHTIVDGWMSSVYVTFHAEKPYKHKRKTMCTGCMCAFRIASVTDLDSSRQCGPFELLPFAIQIRILCNSLLSKHAQIHFKPLPICHCYGCCERWRLLDVKRFRLNILC